MDAKKNNQEVTEAEKNVWKWQDRADAIHRQKIKEREENGGVKTFPTKLCIDLTCNRPISKFLSKKIPVEFGASDYFRHRWLKGFKADFKLSDFKPAVNMEYVGLQKVVRSKPSKTPLYDY